MKDPVEVGKLHEIMRFIEASLEDSKSPRWFRGSGKYPRRLQKLSATRLLI
jgi:hypothetical protein